jgi:hypothetical protein
MPGVETTATAERATIPAINTRLDLRKFALADSTVMQYAGPDY